MSSNPGHLSVPTGAGKAAPLPSPRGLDVDEGPSVKKINPPMQHKAFKSEAPTYNPNEEVRARQDPAPATTLTSPDHTPVSRPPAEMNFEKAHHVPAPSAKSSAETNQQDYERMLKVANVVVFSIMVSTIFVVGSLVYLKPLDNLNNYSLNMCLSLVLAALYAVYLIEGVSIIVLICKLREKFDSQVRLKVMKLKLYSAGIIFNASVAFTALVFALAPPRLNPDDFVLADSYSFALALASLLVSFLDIFLSWYSVYPLCGEQELSKEDRYTPLISLVAVLALPVLCVMSLCCAKKNERGQAYTQAAGNPENNRLNSEA